MAVVAMRICIVAHNAYGMLSGTANLHIGGVELQTAMTAQWLVGQGHKVSVITWQESQGTKEYIDGITVVKTCRQDVGLPLLRFFVPRWTSLIAAMRVADADVYYHNGAEYVTGQVALWARLNRRRFVFSTASDMDCDPALPLLCTHRERSLYRYGLRNADGIITQTVNQQQNLRQYFGLSSMVLPMPSNIVSDTYEKHERGRSGSTMTALFVGRIAPEKNIGMFLRVALANPDIQFLLVGPDGTDGNYADSIKSQASKLSNVLVFGPATREELRNIYKTADVLCCTSEYEGFPNVFIEAWGYGLPVLSTVDPGAVIEHNEIGHHVRHDLDLSQRLRELADDPCRMDRMSSTARRYFKKTHALDNAMPKFENVICG